MKKKRFQNPLFCIEESDAMGHNTSNILKFNLLCYVLGLDKVLLRSDEY
jgi:hypothetical protein